MNILKSLFPLKSMPAQQKTVGDTITARIVAEIPGPIHGIGFELHWSPALETTGRTIYKELFDWSDSDDVAQLVDGHLYIERAIGPDVTPPPTGTYTVCEVVFTCAAAGSAEISIANLLATRYAGDAIKEVGFDGIPAQLEVVMAQSEARGILRVEIV